METGAIAVAGAIDTWNFTANTGDAIVVRVGETVSNTPFTPFLRLFGPGRVLLTTGVSAVVAEVAVRATNSGTFTIEVSDGSGGGRQTGSYRLTLAKTGDPVVVSAGDEGGPMTNGVIHLGDIAIGDLDVWTVVAGVGDSIIVRAGEVVSGSTLYPWIRIFGPSGVLIESSAASAAAEVSIRSTNNGVFTVVVGDGNNGLGGTGAYRLTLAKTGDPVVVSAGDEGGAMTNGLIHLGEISIGDLDVWTVIAGVGDSINVRAGEIVGGSLLYPWIRIFGPGGVLIESASGAAVAEVSIRSTNNGVFTVVVGDGNNGLGGTGAYRLTLAKTGDPVVVSAGDEGGPMTNGAIHLGDIAIGDLDVWTVVAGVGDSIVVRAGEIVSGSTLYPWIRIFGPSGIQLSTVSSAVAAEVSIRSTNNGVFTVVVGDGNNGLGGSGAYRLTLAKTGDPVVVSAGDEGGAMTNGLIHLGEISIGDLDVWTVIAGVGDSINVRAGEIVGGSLLYPWIRIFGPTGAQLESASGAAAAEVETRATENGTFLVIVGDGNNGLGGIGAYRLTLAKIRGATAVSGGDEGESMLNGANHDGEIPTGDLDVWYFSACTGEMITLQLNETGTGTLRPWMRLYGRDGARINSEANANGARISRLIPASGTYVVVIGDGNSGLGGIGSYRLTGEGQYGLYGSAKVCPVKTGSTFSLDGAGWPAGAPYIVTATTDLTLPLAIWTPIATNTFRSFGEISIPNLVKFDLGQQFFHIVPQ